MLNLIGPKKYFLLALFVIHEGKQWPWVSFVKLVSSPPGNNSPKSELTRAMFQAVVTLFWKAADPTFHPMSEHLPLVIVSLPVVPLPGMTSCGPGKFRSHILEDFWTSTSVNLVSEAGQKQYLSINSCWINMAVLKYPSQQVLTADWLWNFSFFPWSFLHLLFSFSGFPPPASLTHDFCHFPSPSLHPLLFHFSLPALVNSSPLACPYSYYSPFPAQYFFLQTSPCIFNLLIFLLLPISLPSLSHGISSGVMTRGVLLAALHWSILHHSSVLSS